MKSITAQSDYVYYLFWAVSLTLLFRRFFFFFLAFETGRIRHDLMYLDVAYNARGPWCTLLEAYNNEIG